MLGRTANNVYWMARYVERAENMARLLSSTYTMSLLPPSGDNGERRCSVRHWQAPIILGGDLAAFGERYGEISAGSVLAYMALDADNVNSILNNVRHARENARMTRTELTTEVWEAINQSYLELQGFSYEKMLDKGFEDFFEWIKNRSHLFRGAIYGTMRRGDAFTFSRLGTFIERADNTARFLSIKWSLLTPAPGKTLAAEDYYRWGALLRGFSAYKAYTEVYSVIVEPRYVAELLVLRPDMPRSLRACIAEAGDILASLRRRAGCTRFAEQIHHRLETSRIDGILRLGLPRYLGDFIARNRELHERIGREFMLVQ